MCAKLSDANVFSCRYGFAFFGYMLLLPHDAAAAAAVVVIFIFVVVDVDVVFVGVAVGVIVHSFAVRYRILRLLLDYYFE